METVDPRWRKSTWRKSTFSQQEGECVEVHSSLQGLRDSKNPAVALAGVDVAMFVRLINRQS
jgi:hypothetical protein